jgi:hypothetical protein
MTIKSMCPVCNAVSVSFSGASDNSHSTISIEDTAETMELCWRCGGKTTVVPGDVAELVSIKDTSAQAKTLEKIAEYLQRLVEHLEMSEFRDEQENKHKGGP